jgi:CHAT domain
LSQLSELPSLIVLASCQSAGSGGSGALAAVGPLLARAGVPSVLAMQGKISLVTAREFMGHFFTELRRDGQIDRAAAVARAKVRGRPDVWMPVLFTRLSSGRIWSDVPERPVIYQRIDTQVNIGSVTGLNAAALEALFGPRQVPPEQWQPGEPPRVWNVPHARSPNFVG